MSENQIWYVAINDEQVGPLSEEEVLAEIAAGNVGGDTFIWRDGLEDWVSVADSGVFSDAIPGDFVAAAADSADSFFASLDAGGSSGDAGASIAALAASVPVAQSSFGSASSIASAASAGSRNENSVLFSLDELASTTKKTMASGPSVTEGSGLIDLSALAATPMTAPARDDASHTNLASSPATVQMPVIALAQPKKSAAPAALFALAGIVIAGLVVGILFVSGVIGGKDDAPETPAMTQEEINAQIARAAEEAANSARAATIAEQERAAEEAAAAKEAEERAAQEAARAAAAAAPAREERAERSGSSTRTEDTRTAAAAPSTPRTPSSSGSSTSGSSSRSGSSTGSGSGSGGDSVSAALAAISGTPSGGGSSSAPAAAPAADGGALTDTQIRTTIRRYQSAVQRCATGEDSAGQYRVSFTINPDGSTSGARSQGGGAVGECVAGVAGTMRFPASSSSRNLNYTFAIR